MGVNMTSFQSLTIHRTAVLLLTLVFIIISQTQTEARRDRWNEGATGAVILGSIAGVSAAVIIALMRTGNDDDDRSDRSATSALRPTPRKPVRLAPHRMPAIAQKAFERRFGIKAHYQPYQSLDLVVP